MYDSLYSFVIYNNTALLWRVFTITESAEGVRQVCCQSLRQKDRASCIFFGGLISISSFFSFRSFSFLR